MTPRMKLLLLKRLYTPLESLTKPPPVRLHGRQRPIGCHDVGTTVPGIFHRGFSGGGLEGFSFCELPQRKDR